MSPLLSVVRSRLWLALLAAYLATGLDANLSVAADGAVSDDVVRIGLILELTGPTAYLAGEGSVTAARMAVEDFGGQLLGYPIEVLSADHANLSYVAAAKAAEWFDSGKVDALMEVSATSPALAVAKVARQKDRIVVFNRAASARLTNEACTPVTFHWTYDSYALAHVTGREIARNGGDSWYFVTADNGYGHALEKDTTEVVRAAGGKVFGSSMHAVDTPDFRSHMLRARQSGAKVIGLATGGVDLVNAMKAVGLPGASPAGTQRLAALLASINDVHNLGLAMTQGLYLASAFYWNLNEESRAWSQRFLDVHHEMPNMTQAGVYSSTMHYLKAVQAAGTDRTADVMKKMRELPVNFFGKTGWIREDGRMMHDMYLFEVKRPGESAVPWDYFKLRATVPANEAYRPLAKSACPLIKH